MKTVRNAVPVIVATAIAMAGPAASAGVPPAAGTSNPPAARHQADPEPKAIERQSFFTHEHDLDGPTGATYLDGPGLLVVAEPRPGGSAMVLLRPQSEDVVGRMDVRGLSDPVTLADDGRGGLAAVQGQALLTWRASSRGSVSARQRPIVGEAITDARGMTYDPTAGRWLVLDAAEQRIVVLKPEGKTVRATRGPSLTGLGASELRGIALDPSTDRIYIADAGSDELHVVSRSAETVDTLDLADTDLEMLSSMAVGATADPTDDADLTSLYVTDAGGVATFGRVAELSSTAVEAAVEAPLSSTATLVRRTLLSELVPPSPDPSGIAYMSDRDQFLVVDSEVEEMTIYADVNLWQLSRDGSTLHGTGNTRKYSNEPTGIAYDAAGGRAFVSDDGRKRIYTISPGQDGRFGTDDDPTTFFSVSAFGNDDPEDVTYDTVSGDLFVAQGVGAEVWRVSPGPNGRFDGIAPAGDDIVSHFDVGVFGVIDLEGIGYSSVRDSLFLADRKTTKILEVTKTGALVQVIDVAGIKMLNPAGIALAPSTADAGRTSMYVVTRGVDNDKDPNENDGVMYELSAPYLGPVGEQPNVAPSVDAGSDAAVVLPGPVALDGTVTDDGLPDPPGAVTVAWSKVSGPGVVTFGDAGSVDTTAMFDAAGSYVLRLTASDSTLTASDEVTVVVSSSAGVNLVGNPGFEDGTNGWKGSSGTEVVRVATPHSGDWAAQVTNVGTGSTTCQLNDSPNWVGTTGAGTYTATAWVKGDEAVAGTATRLRFREYAGKTLVGSKESSVTLSTDWQQIVLTYVPTSPGSSTLDFDVMRSSVRAGTLCFEVDDIAITTTP